MTSSVEFAKIHRASPFEEFAGSLKELFVQDCALVAHIGKILLSLPLDMEQSLQPLIGQRITILRTDIPEKPYVFRVLAQDANCPVVAARSEDGSSK